jgi:hypothetical protein
MHPEDRIAEPAEPAEEETNEATGGNATETTIQSMPERSSEPDVSTNPTIQNK